MNYLLYGTEKYLIEEEINKIIKKYHVNDISIIKYDLASDSLKDILDDAATVSLFETNKIILINNAIIFNRGNKDDNIDKLIKYLSNSNPDTILIFINNNSTIDNTKKITKLIKEKGIIKELTNNNMMNSIKNMCSDYSIDNATISLLVNRVGNNLSILENEIKKIKLYKIEEKSITKEDVLNLTTAVIDTDIFKFIDNIISKEKSIALKTYFEMIKEGEEPIKMIALLASKFRLMYQSVELTKMGYSQQDISNTLNTHIYPIKLAINAGLKYNSNLLLKYLKNLANLDIDIKTGKIDPVLGLELFILDV